MKEIKECFKTGRTLQEAIDNPEKVKGMEDYLDRSFIYNYFDTDNTEEQFEILDGKLTQIPYWLEEHQSDNKLCQYQNGYYENLSIGDTCTNNGIEYRYVDTQPLSEEIEHQADNGDLCYEYRGYSYMRIWEATQEEGE